MTGAEGISALKDPLLGTIVQGRYRISRTIGRGGMGVVYEAQHLLIGRKVALKTLTARASLSSAAVSRFRREAQAAASVGNSHVVDVLDMGELDDGSLYIVLEHLEGVHLGWAVAQERRFPAVRAVHVLCQLCDALSAVHAAGIVHRDLKPENIFLIQRDGEPDFVKVLDFGVCKFKDAGGASLTSTGDTVGTPLFMAPEQVEGRRDIDHRTDVYALGAILYFLLTGRAPFQAATLPRLFMRICSEPPPSARDADVTLPDGLDEVVQRALSKSPSLRFESCSEFRQALLPFQDAAAPRSGTRKFEDQATTLPVATAAAFIGYGPAPSDTANLVESLKLRRSRLPTTRAAGWAALILCSVALLIAVGSQHFGSVSPVVAAPTAKGAPHPSAPAPATLAPDALPDSVVPPTQSATKSVAGSLREHRQFFRARIAPASTPAVAPVASSNREPAPEAPAPSGQRGAAPSAASSVGTAVPELRLNREPKRGL